MYKAIGRKKCGTVLKNGRETYYREPLAPGETVGASESEITVYACDNCGRQTEWLAGILTHVACPDCVQPVY